MKLFDIKAIKSYEQIKKPDECKSDKNMINYPMFSLLHLSCFKMYLRWTSVSAC